MLGGVPVAVNPNEVEPDGPSVPLWGALLTDTVGPLALSVPFHTWETVWPLLTVHPTVQPAIAAPLAVTVTSPSYPPGHELTVR